MGKWTAEYLDDVLATKVKGLVTGAIKRSKLEKTDPTISYETFVQELDSGDAFTTSVVEILVKELADRRLRSDLPERRLIADRTAKSLRLLATPIRVYRDRNGGRALLARRSMNLTDYLSTPPDEMTMEEEDDEFENLLENGGSNIEGARLNHDLYDAFGGSHGTSSLARRPHPYLTSGTSTEPHILDAVLPPMHSPPVPSRHHPFPIHTSHTSLARQPSIRRPFRATDRSVDFNDFTARRRSTSRQSSSQEPLGFRTDAADESGRLPSLLPTPARSPAPENSASPSANPISNPQMRRFFPFNRTHRQELSRSSSDSSDARHSTESSLRHMSRPESQSRAPWYLIHESVEEARSPVGENVDGDDGTTAATPRLRRGGLRAPESMLSRHASPSVGVTLFDSTPTLRAVASGEHTPPSDTLIASEDGVVDEVTL